MLNCRECTRLWRVYERANSLYLQLVTRRRYTSFANDQRRVIALESEIDAALTDRDCARQSINVHEVKDHPDRAMRTAQ